MLTKLSALVFLLPSTAFAHAVESPSEAYPWYAIIIANLSALSFFYVRGWKEKQGEAKSLFFFISAVVSVLLALLPPIDTLSGELLSVHMVQHMLLMMAAAPFFVFSYSDYFVKMGLGAKNKRKVWAFTRASSRLRLNKLTKPLLVALLYAAILWIWHLPYLYELALEDRLIHNIQHLLFFGVSYFFWKVLLRKIGAATLNSAAGIVYLFVASLHSAALGVLMALSPQRWYAYYEGRTVLHGLSIIEDQQIAGYIMWMPAGISYALVAIWLVWKLLRDSESSPSKTLRRPHG